MKVTLKYPSVLGGHILINYYFKKITNQDFYKAQYTTYKQVLYKNDDFEYLWYMFDDNINNIILSQQDKDSFYFIQSTIRTKLYESGKSVYSDVDVNLESSIVKQIKKLSVSKTKPIDFKPLILSSDLKETLRVVNSKIGFYNYSNYKLFENLFDFNSIVNNTINLNNYINWVKELKLSYNYFDIAKSDSLKISYLNNNRKVDDDNKWNPEKRVMFKASKFFKTLFPSEPDLAISKMNDAFINLRMLDSDCYECNNDFKYVYGNEIKHYYLEKNYYSKDAQQSTQSSLWDSCMRYSECQDYLDIYSKNPEVVKLGILTIDNKVIARALVWEDKYYDRIYALNNTINRQLESIFINSDLTNVSSKNLSGNDTTREIVIKLKNNNFDKYPYMDTFAYYSPEYNQLSNYEYTFSDYHTLNGTDGEYSDSTINESLFCPNCDEELDDSDDLMGNGCIHCHTCTEDGDIYPNDEIIAIWNGEIYHQDDVFYDNVGNIYEHENWSVELYNKQEVSDRYHTILEDSNGDYFIEGDENFIYNEETDEYNRI